MDLDNKKIEAAKVEEPKEAVKEQIKYEEIRGIPYRKLEKSAKVCMRISSIIVFAFILVPATVLAVIFMDDIAFGLKCALGVIWGLSLIYIGIAPNIRYERYRYNIDETAIRVRSGLLWISEEIVPIERLHKLQTSQGPFDRIFELSKLMVTTAGGDVTIKFLKDEEAEEIAESLKKKINDIAIAERMK